MDQRVMAAVLALDEPVRSTLRNRLRRGLEVLRARFDAEHGGDRGAWLALLRPAPRLRPVPWPVPLGVLAMTTTAKVSAALLLLAGVAGWVW
ncbi:MAG: hypothetical protein AB1726_10580 [Planctomycetota bacterium]